MAELIALASPMTSAGIVGRRILRKPTLQKQRLSPDCFLDAYDIPTSNSLSYQVPVLKTSTRSEHDVKNALDYLLEQEADSIRVFINEFDEDGLTGHLFSRLQSTGPLHPQCRRVAEIRRQEQGPCRGPAFKNQKAEAEAKRERP